MEEEGGGELGSFHPVGHQKLTPMTTSRWRTHKAISNDADNKGTAAEMKSHTTGAPLVAKAQRSSKVTIATTLLLF
ncbi:unnamed protein product [Hymenolepis diminuta]|uniref:Uncharacterized protein n=1 Tax=Hymenolepis diminuta TaxID=6216 RepID=A0A0R3STK6_HYMDI|nr:unnamed protein product [Hymenolepis diminuta]